jgi:NTP pyrophosphatase (non-canonical NTP hydrolase)
LLKLNAYQTKAQQTDKYTAKGGDRLFLPLLGLVGETGGLISAYKKFVRDGDTYRNFYDVLAEEIGDVLWYIANISYKFDVKLSNVVRGNIEKIRQDVIKNKYKNLDAKGKAKALSLLDTASKTPHNLLTIIKNLSQRPKYILPMQMCG